MLELFFEKEKCKRYMNKRMNVIDRLSEATGISQRCLRNIHTEFLANDGKFLSPINRYTASRVRINTDSFDREAIRRVVHDFYIKKEYPTLSAVLKTVRTDGVFHGGRFYQSMGFFYKKADNKRFLYKQHDIIEQRHTYLQAIRKLRQQNKTIVYTDETWVNAHHTKEYIWVDYDGKGGWKVPSGKRQRLIVVHAGGVEGWVDGADLVFKSKTNSADYHNEINTEHYMEWFTQQLLPNLPPNSVIIVDSATYHNKQKDKPPTTANKKDDIKQWLNRQNIQYDETDIKKDATGQSTTTSTQTHLPDK